VVVDLPVADQVGAAVGRGEGLVVVLTSFPAIDVIVTGLRNAG
jgi:hypothetical protein